MSHLNLRCYQFFEASTDNCTNSSFGRRKGPKISLHNAIRFLPFTRPTCISSPAAKGPFYERGCCWRVGRRGEAETQRRLFEITRSLHEHSIFLVVHHSQAPHKKRESSSPPRACFYEWVGKNERVEQPAISSEALVSLHLLNACYFCRSDALRFPSLLDAVEFLWRGLRQKGNARRCFLPSSNVPDEKTTVESGILLRVGSLLLL
jgi:hypothetical protein